MADFGSPVAQNVNVNPQQGLNTLSSLVGIQQQKQALQTGAYTQQSAQAAATQAQQAAQENQGMAQLAKDPIGNGLIDEKGNVLPGSYAKVLQVAPTTGANRYNDLMTAAKGGVDYRNAYLGLQTNTRNLINSRLAGIAADPKTTTADALKGAVDNIRSDFKGTPDEDNVNKLADVSQQAIGAISKTHGMEGVRQYLLSASRGSIGNAGITGPGGVATPQNEMVDTGPTVQPTVVAPALAGGGATAAGAPIIKSPTPSERIPRTGTNAANQTVVYNPLDPNQASLLGSGHVPTYPGAIPGPPMRPGTQNAPQAPAAQAAPSGPPGLGINPTSTQVAQQTSSATAGSSNDEDRYKQVSQEGTNAQTGTQLADQVAQLADQVRTGKYSSYWTNQLAVLKQKDPGITARQMLNKYAAQLKTMATQNATTDASREQIDNGMPNPDTMNEGAVKEAAQYVGGIFRMRQARQTYADQYVKNNGGSLGIRDVDDSFMKAADPTVFAYNALPVGDERRQFAQAHGINTVEKAQAFKARLNQVNHYGGQ